MPLELLPLTAPALLVVSVAVRLATRDRAGRDDVLDLRDVPRVALATRSGAAGGGVSLAPLQGALVEPSAGGSLGARLRSTAPAVPGAHDGPAVERPPAGRVVLVRRRRPLVALSREQSPR